MKYVIFHFRTGGFDSSEHSIIEVAAIVEDTKNKLNFESIPKYRTLVYNEIYKGDPYAFYLNSEMLKEINDAIKNQSNTIVPLDMLALDLYTWLSKYIDTYVDDSNYMLDFNSFGKNYSGDGVAKTNKKSKLLINVGGKNFGVLQHRFLKKIPNINEYISLNHRFIDPSILFFESDDDSLPNTEQCKARAGIIISNSNNSLNECWDVINMLRKKLNY
jgi:hypothetical protein